MKTKIALACATAAMLTAPTLAAGNAAAGLQSLRELNLTVFNTLTTNGQEVEGRTFAGTLNASNSTNFGIGASAHPSQGGTGNGYDVLDVVNNASGSWRLKAGYANGTNGSVGDTARIGGSVGDVDFNDTNNAVGKLIVGGSLTGSMNVNNHSVTYGGTAAGGINGAVHDASLATGGANDVHAYQLGRLNTLQSNLTALSNTLAGMSSLATITSTASALNYSGATNGYAVFTMTKSAFEDQNANFDNLFGAVPTGYVTIINVLGTNLVEQGNINGASLNQSVIWNFNQAQTLSLKGFHGSVLATQATVSNSSAIEGSIVANNFSLNGEVHLGTFAGNGNFLNATPGGVPEPASWAMMLAGFGAVGAALRRRSALRFA